MILLTHPRSGDLYVFNQGDAGLCLTDPLFGRW